MLSITYSRVPGYRVNIDFQGENPVISVYSGDKPVRKGEISDEDKEKLREFTSQLGNIDESKLPFWKRIFSLGWEEIDTEEEVYQWVGDPQEELEQLVNAIEEVKRDATSNKTELDYDNYVNPDPI